MKSLIRQTVAAAYHGSGHYLLRHQGRAAILMYHRVVPEEELRRQYIQPGMYVTSDVFEKQVRFLTRHFEVISMMEMLGLWSENNWDKRKRYCVITFDDGWLDNYLYAYPVLRRYDVAATIFLPTEFIGTRHWFWQDRVGYFLNHYCNYPIAPDERDDIKAICDSYPGIGDLEGPRCRDRIDAAIEGLKGLSEAEIGEFISEMSRAMGIDSPANRLLLNWEEVEEMSEHAITFGSHSCTHRILTKLPKEEINREIEGSLRTLQERGINYIPVFCYPNGDYNGGIAKQLETAGYRAAVSTEFGFEDNSTRDLYSLRRIGIHNDITSRIPLFTYRLSGIGNRAVRTRAGYLDA